jgi:hypothetical protein
MHLSRRRNVLFFAEKTLRPGDGERWADKAPKAEVAYNYIQCQDRKY